MYRRLGDPVHVHDGWLPVTVTLEPRRQAVHFECLAAENDVPKGQRARAGRLLRYQQLPEG